MAGLVFSHLPNKLFANPGAPGNTNFNDLTYPTGVPRGGPNYVLSIKCTNAAGTGSGSVMLISDTAAADATTWEAILPGQTLIITCPALLSYKCTVASDIPVFAFYF